MNSSRARWLDFLHRISIPHPIPVLVIAAAVTAAASPGILKLRLRTDGQALVPEQAPAVRVDRATRREFGVRDPVVVLVRPRDAAGIFTPRTLRLVSDLTAALVHLPGVDSAGVTSLATERSDRFRPRSLVRYRLLDPLPGTPAELDRLRGDLEAFGVYTGTLVAFDGASTAILVGTPWGVDRTALVTAIRGAIARSDTAGHDVSVIGAPVAEALLGAHILEDLGVRTGPGPSGGRSGEGLGALSRLRIAIARNVGLLPLSIVVMALVFLLCFRSLAAVLLPLGEAAACLVFVFGAMGWTGTPVFLTMAVLPVILVSMGLADEIHVFHCYRRHRAARPDAPAAEVVRAALDDMSLPVVATSLTTAVGFLSFAFSPLPPVRAFGVFTAAGIVFCMFWTLTVIPALLTLLAPRGLMPPRSGGAPGGRRSALWLRLAMAPVRRPVATLATVAVALALMAPGWRRIVVQDSWISGFAPDSDFYRDTQYFNRHFFGTHRLLLVLEAERVDARALVTTADLGRGELRLPGGLLEHPERAVGCSISVSRRGEDAAVLHAEAYRPRSWGSLVESAAPESGRIVVKTPLAHGSPAFLLMPAPGETLEVAIRSHPLALPGVLRSVEELERFVRSQTACAVGGVLGPPDHIVAAEFVTSDRQPEFRRIPDDPERVRWLWGALEQTLGAERVREIADPTLHRGLVTVFLKNANFVDTGRLMEAVRGFERERLAPLGIRLEFAGDVAVSQALIEAIVHSQVSSIVGSLIGILVVTAALFLSVGWGVVCMLPAGIAVAATFAAMGWTGTPLGVATSMFAAMVLGVGVDFAIHLVEGFRQRVARGADPDPAIGGTLEGTGPAIVANALALALGFGLLSLSRVPANARLGAITVVSLLACVAATFLVIPALLRLGARAARRAR
jgi:predicted RND superfamily exporter protein